MEHNYLLYITGFACAFAITLVTTPFAKKLSIKVGAIDYPRKRGMHNEPVPRMGGVAIVLGFMIAMLVLLPFVPELQSRQFLGFMAGALIIAAAGVLDDIYSIRPKTKLIMQILAALVVIFTGTQINMFNWPVLTHLDIFSGPITLLWIVGVTNAVNLIDGVDGLAAGVCSICSLCLMVLCILSGSPMAVIFTSALAGSCMGFLPRNFSPAEVFMGDTGALFLGYVLSVSSIIGVYKAYTVLSIVIAVLVLALPILDTLFAMLRRFIKGKPIMQADRGHLHHRLIDAGYSQRRAVVVLYGLSAIAGVIAIVIAIQDLWVTLIVLGFLLVMLLMLYVYRNRMNQ